MKRIPSRPATLVGVALKRPNLKIHASHWMMINSAKAIANSRRIPVV
jgi:hypothetical protein